MVNSKFASPWLWFEGVYIKVELIDWLMCSEPLRQKRGANWWKRVSVSVLLISCFFTNILVILSYPNITSIIVSLCPCAPADNVNSHTACIRNISSNCSYKASEYTDANISICLRGGRCSLPLILPRIFTTCWHSHTQAVPHTPTMCELKYKIR